MRAFWKEKKAHESAIVNYETREKKRERMMRFSFSRRGNERGLSSFDFIARAKCVSFFSFLKVGWGKITKRDRERNTSLVDNDDDRSHRALLRGEKKERINGLTGLLAFFKASNSSVDSTCLTIFFVYSSRVF